MTSELSELSVPRAQFTFSTQGIVTHSQARGGEARAQPTFFMSARPKPLETLNLSLAIPSEAQIRSNCRCQDALKKYKPQELKYLE